MGRMSVKASTKFLDPRHRPIAVFDSGLGGLTVVRQILALMPGEDVVYLGDSARVPYGTKSPSTIREFALQDARFLMGFSPKAMVVACNTASAVALPVLRQRVERGDGTRGRCKVIGVVVPAAQEAVRRAAGRTIGVIGTEATIASGAYQNSIARQDGSSKVLSAAAPLLVPIVEEGRGEQDPIVLHVLSDYLREMQRARPAVLILGCTHYPLLSRAIGKLMGPDTQLLDPGVATAVQLRDYLRQAGLLSPRRHGRLRCFSTDNAMRFARLAQRFLGRPVGRVKWVGTDELAAQGENS
jgi:glutamate racemase